MLLLLSMILTTEPPDALISDTRPLAKYERLEGAYEKTTNSWLLDLDGDGTWELVTSTFLLDFERAAPEARNITGHESSVSTFKKGKFEFQSNALPQTRGFPIKK